jgi:hypothetical protein
MIFSADSVALSFDFYGSMQHIISNNRLCIDSKSVPQFQVELPITDTLSA